MDLKEMLKKQKERGFKKITSTSNTLSITDYLSDQNASRPYLDNSDTSSRPLSTDINANNDASIIETTESTLQEIVKVGTEKIIPLSVIEEKKVPETGTISIISPSISDTKATQVFISATQQYENKSTTATQELEIKPQKVTQEFRSATQTATQVFKKNHSKVGRPKTQFFDYNSLIGNELKIINEIYSECVKSKTLETGYIEKHEFSQRVNVKTGAIRTSCTRLRIKGILDDFIATKGRGSTWKFVLSEGIFHQILMKNTTKLELISDTNNDTKILSSRRSNINKTTTIQLPADWKKIEYAELQKVLNVFNERFGLAQIKSVFAVAGDSITAIDVQQSIFNFTEGLNNFLKKPTPGIYDRKVKIVTLIEALKNGEIFIDPKMEAAREAEEKRVRAEKRKEAAKQYFEPKVKQYVESLSDEQLLSFIPEKWKKNDLRWADAVKKNDMIMQKTYAIDFAKEHFQKNIWPDILEVLLN